MKTGDRCRGIIGEPLLCLFGSLRYDLDDRPQKRQKLFSVLRQAARQRDRFQTLGTFGLRVTERTRELQRLAACFGFFGEELGTRAALLE